MSVVEELVGGARGDYAFEMKVKVRREPFEGVKPLLMGTSRVGGRGPCKPEAGFHGDVLEGIVGDCFRSRTLCRGVDLPVRVTPGYSRNGKQVALDGDLFCPPVSCARRDPLCMVVCDTPMI